MSSSVLSVSILGCVLALNCSLRLGHLLHDWPHIWGLGVIVWCIFFFFLPLLFSSISSGSGTKGSMRGEFGLVLIGLGIHSLHNGAFSSSLFLLLASAVFPCCCSTICQLSLSFCLVPSQSYSDDQSECTGDEKWYWCEIGLYPCFGWFVWCLLYCLGTSKMLGGLEGEVRFTIVVVAVVVGHVDITVEGAKCPMSNFLFFWDLLLLFLQKLSFPY